MAQHDGSLAVPRTPRPFAVFSFATTHQALEAEDAMRSGGVGVVPIPTPASGSTLCGLSMRVETRERDAAHDLLERAGIIPAEEIEILDV